MTIKVYTPLTADEELTDARLRDLAENSTWDAERRLAAELLEARASAAYWEKFAAVSLKKSYGRYEDIEIMTRERDEARQWAIKLHRENKRLLARIGELEIELEEAMIGTGNRAG